MDAKHIVKENLKTLMSHDRALKNPYAVGEKAGVGKSTVQRALQCTSGMKLEKLESLAKAFELEPWQILIPELDPASPHKEIAKIFKTIAKMSDEDLEKLMAYLFKRQSDDVNPRLQRPTSLEHTSKLGQMLVLGVNGDGESDSFPSKKHGSKNN